MTKGRCVCGRTGAVKVVTRHAMQCGDYRALYRSDPKNAALDVAKAWEASQTPEALEAAVEAAQDARDARGMARRESNEHALATSRSRWSDGRGGFADGVPVTMPDEGRVWVHAPATSARAQVEEQFAKGDA